MVHKAERRYRVEKWLVTYRLRKIMSKFEGNRILEGKFVKIFRFSKNYGYTQGIH